MSKPWIWAAALVLVVFGPAVAATSIQYTLVPVGGNVYRYVYTVTNNSPIAGAPVQLFDIYFDTSLYLESSLLSSVRALLI